MWQQAGAQGDASAQIERLDRGPECPAQYRPGAGIPAALTTFFSDVSAWSAAPTNASAQQSVIVMPPDPWPRVSRPPPPAWRPHPHRSARIFKATGRSDQSTDHPGGRHECANPRAAASTTQGLQAQMYSSLETLSGLVNISVLHAAGRQRQRDPLERSRTGDGRPVLRADPRERPPPPAQPLDPQAPPDMDIQAADGSVVNGQITSGTLAGLAAGPQRDDTRLDRRCQPARRAQSTAAQIYPNAVNAIVSQGSVSAGAAAGGAGPVHDAESQLTPAAPPPPWRSIPNMTASQLPAIDQNGVANGVPLALGRWPIRPLPTLDSMATTPLSTAIPPRWWGRN